MSTPEPPPEAVLIRVVRQAARISVTSAARAAGVSKPWWSMIEAGYQSRQGVHHPIAAKPDVLARMAWAIGLPPDRLAEVRPDAIPVLEEILRQQGPRKLPPIDPDPVDDRPPAVRDNPDDQYVQMLWGNERIPRDGREALIADYLVTRDREATGGALARAPSPAALARFIELAENRRKELGFSRPQIAARARIPIADLDPLLDGSPAGLRENDPPALDHALYWRPASAFRTLYEDGSPSPLPARTVEVPPDVLRAIRGSDPDAGAAGA